MTHSLDQMRLTVISKEGSRLIHCLPINNLFDPLIPWKPVECRGSVFIYCNLYHEPDMVNVFIKQENTNLNRKRVEIQKLSKNQVYRQK